MGFSNLIYEDYVADPAFYGTHLPKWAYALNKKGYNSISPIDFYNSIFGEDLEDHRSPEDYRSGEYGAIAVEKKKRVDKNGKPILRLNKKTGKKVETYRGHRITITKGNLELYRFIEESEGFCLMSPISYAGKHRTLKNARYLYALCIDVDHLKPNGLRELIHSWTGRPMEYRLPKPTYIVCSGRGLHLYYVFKKAIPLWPNIFKAIADAKTDLTRRLWSSYVTAKWEKPEYESLVQGFRIPGTITKDGGYALAFECGEKVTIEYMNQFLPADKQMTEIYKTDYTRAQAKALFPDWYKRRVENGEPRGHWTRHPGIYYNWKEKILDGAVVGHRYNCLENLCSLAVQCNIPPDVLERDCHEVMIKFESMTDDPDNHFEEYDVLCAMKTYHLADEGAYRRRVEYIAQKTGIHLTPAKRNGRKQEVHLRRIRALQKADYPKDEWRNRKGQPSKSSIVKMWRLAHPDGRKIDCQRETGLSRPTILKHWAIKPLLLGEAATPNIETFNIEFEDERTVENADD
jgi:hypothetical protein